MTTFRMRVAEILNLSEVLGTTGDAICKTKLLELIEEVDEAEVITRLSKDLKCAVTTMTPKEARFLVDSYYQSQDNRLRANGQIRSMSEGIEAEGHKCLDWLAENDSKLENQIKAALDAWSKSKPMGIWARKIKGIGPMLAAGLLAHIDIEKAPTVGHIWRFAGLDPTCKWEKKKKRPYNAALKVLCWKIGESFVKVSGYEDDIYGKVYLARKELEAKLNAAGAYAEQAKAGLEHVDSKTEAAKFYAQGLLPPGHLHSRAKRYAVKLFLSHWWEEAYRQHFKNEPPSPYPIQFGGHVHKIPAPNSSQLG
jgi:hypothetical protein